MSESWFQHRVLCRIKPYPNFRCGRCHGRARPIDDRPTTEFPIDDQTLEVVDSFCYLGDMTSGGGRCDLSSITHIHTAWGKFRELCPCSLPDLHTLVVRSTTPASEVLCFMLANAGHPQVFLRIQRNAQAMICWICNVHLVDRVSSDSLLHKLNIHRLESMLQYNGHVERSVGWINKVMHHVVEGIRESRMAEEGHGSMTSRQIASHGK